MKTISVIYENDEIILVNKEAGVSVQGGAGIAHPMRNFLNSLAAESILCTDLIRRQPEFLSSQKIPVPPQNGQN